jgi:hypothetical protein
MHSNGRKGLCYTIVVLLEENFKMKTIKGRKRPHGRKKHLTEEDHKVKKDYMAEKDELVENNVTVKRPQGQKDFRVNRTSC